MDGQAHIGLGLVTRPPNVEAALWRKFHIDKDIKFREQLFTFYQDFAVKIAKTEFRNRPCYGLEFEDFRQLANSGLLEAIDRFAPLRNIPFEAFARRRIKGSISDGIGQSSEHAAHYLHRRAQNSDRLKSLMEQTELRTQSAVDKLGDVVIGLALGLLLEASQVPDIRSDEPDPYESLALKEVGKHVLVQLKDLPDPDGLVLRSHYLDGIPFLNIAQTLSVSKGRISQIHRGALDKLKAKLQKLEWGSS